MASYILLMHDDILDAVPAPEWGPILKSWDQAVCCAVAAKSVLGFVYAAKNPLRKYRITSPVSSESKPEILSMCASC